MAVNTCDMMIYRKYLFKLLIQIFGLTTFVLTSVVMLSQFLKLINQYIGKGFEIANILLLLFFILPPFLVQIVPITLFCTILFVYQKLITDNELVIMESSGISRLNLAIPGILFAVIVMTASYTITIFVNPYLNRLHESQKTLIRDNYISSMLEEKVFNNLSKDLTIYINKQLDENRLSGIIIYDQREGMPAIITAQTAKLIPIANGLLIELNKGSRQHLNQNKQIEILFFDSSSIIVQYNKLNEIKRNYSPNQLYIYELISNSVDNQKLRNDRNFEINKRFSWPLLNLALASIAISTVLSISYNRIWKYKNIILGAAAASFTVFLSLIFTNKSQNSMIFTIALYLNPFLVTYLSLYILKQKSCNNKLIPKELQKIFLNFRKLASHLYYK